MRRSSDSDNVPDESDQNAFGVLEADPSHVVKDIFENQSSREAQRMRAEIARVARRPYNILITGETGTGKTEMARQIHRMSARSGNPFIELNCANLPEHLVEAELFGHRKGLLRGRIATALDYSRRLMVGFCSWMKLVTSPQPFRTGC